MPKSSDARKGIPGLPPNEQAAHERHRSKVRKAARRRQQRRRSG